MATPTRILHPDHLLTEGEIRSGLALEIDLASGRITRIGPINELRGEHPAEVVRLNDRVAAPFYVDTAASHVSIPASVADQLGIDPESTTHTLVTRTANGTVPLAAVKLASVGVGAAQVSDVRGTINPGLDVGLLGASFLNNFTYLVDTASQVLVLRPRRQ